MKRMKKFFALTMALAMSLAMPTATMALPQSISEPASYDFTLELNFGLDVQYDGALPVALHFFRDVRLNATGTFVSEEDGLVAHTFMVGDLHAGFFHMPFTAWSVIDMQDLENPTYLSVIRIPESFQFMFPLDDDSELSEMYFVTDSNPFIRTIFDFISENYEQADTIDADADEELEALLGIFRSAFNFEETGRNSYRLRMDDYELTESLIYLTESVLDWAYELDGEINPAEISDDLDLIFDFMRRVTFISDTMEINRRFNNAGYEIFTSMEVSLVIDLPQWARALEAVIPEDAYGLSDEMPEMVITADFEFIIEYENINRATVVPLPELTPENSVNINSIFDGFFFQQGPLQGPVGIIELVFNSSEVF